MRRVDDETLWTISICFQAESILISFRGTFKKTQDVYWPDPRPVDSWHTGKLRRGLWFNGDWASCFSFCCGCKNHMFENDHATAENRHKDEWGCCYHGVHDWVSPPHCSCDRRPGGEKIYAIFDHQLPAALKKLPFDKHLSMQNVRKVVSEADGYQPHLIAPEQGYRRLIESGLSYFRGPAEAVVDAVSRATPSHVFTFCTSPLSWPVVHKLAWWSIK